MKYLILSLLLVLSSLCHAQITSEWRGPAREGKYPDQGLLTEWPAGGPEKLWSVDVVLKGYSSPAMGEKYIYVTGREDTIEYLTALDYSGTLIWQVPFGLAWNKSYPETRTTPTLYQGKVYVISGQGEVVCLDEQTGEKIWYQDGFNLFSSKTNIYGPSESALIVDDKVIYSPGGPETSLVALDCHTGELIWKSASINDRSAYVNPILVNHNGRDMICTILSNHALGVDPANGKILWKFDYIGLPTDQTNGGMIITNCNSPLYKNGELFINKGYDHPSAMLKIHPAGDQVELKWMNKDLDTHMGGYVLVDGYLYGSNWINNGMGNWVCIDWETGTTQWEETWQNKGSIIFADGLLYLFEEKRGNVALVKPNPKKLEIISSFRINEGTGPHWAHPVIHHGRLYLRHGKVLLSYNISGRE